MLGWPIRFDDQAETVLLGLAVVRAYYRSPACVRTIRLGAGLLLGVRRVSLRGLPGWPDRRQDPHNTDRASPEPTRNRSAATAGGRAGRRWSALPAPRQRCARTPDLIDTIAAQALPGAAAAGLTGTGVEYSALTALPDAVVRRRVIWVGCWPAHATGLTGQQIGGVDWLVTAWRGQAG